MSSWVFPTTADVGIRTFSHSLEGVIEEATIGIQEYQILKHFTLKNSFPRYGDLGGTDGRILKEG